MNSIDVNYEKDKIHSIDGSKYRESYLEFLKQDSRYQKRIDLLRGHQFYGAHKYMRKGAVYFTMLREPMSRLASLYNYLREIDLYSVVNEKNMNLGSFLDSGVAMAADNGMTRMLTNKDFDKIPNGEISSAHALEAIDNLERNFKVVGLTEKFNESLELFRIKLKWNSVPTYAKENVTKRKALIQTNVAEFFDEHQEYRRFVNADLMVYEYAYSRFQKEFESKIVS